MKDYRYILLNVRDNKYVCYDEGFPGDEGCEPSCYLADNIYLASLWFPKQPLPPEVCKLVKEDEEGYQWIRVKLIVFYPDGSHDDSVPKLESCVPMVKPSTH